MRRDRLSRFLALSLAGHLLALLCGTTVVWNLPLPAPLPETVCFVNPVQAPPRGEGGPGGERTLLPAKTKPGFPAPPAPPGTKPAIPRPIRPAQITTLPHAEPKGQKRETPAPPAASSRPAASSPAAVPAASSSGGSAGGGETGGVPGGTGTGTGGGGGTGRGGRGGAGDGPPGEVGFGAASGISYAHQVKPAYPALARRFNREGRVLLRLTVAETGALVKVDVLEDPGFGLAAAAVEAVRKSRFNPARREGRPFAAQALLPVRFTLGGGE